MRKTTKQIRRTSQARIAIGVSTVIGILVLTSIAFMAPVSGAIFTTDLGCTGTNVNIFASKDAVYLDGGPAHPGAAGLPDGEYYVKVTTPGGTLLGTSVGSADDTPVTVTAGEFATCYQLSAILIKASDSSAGYDDTTNPGGEYKVWLSAVSTFDNSDTKTDNFKVRCDDCGGNPPQGTINVVKYYDVNANGALDLGTDIPITGWKVRIQDDIDFIRFTPASLVVFTPDTYTVSEANPIETNWQHTTPSIIVYALAVNETHEFDFGNVCLGAGGGLTLGFWSNKNGASVINTKGLLPGVEALCLRNPDGSLLGTPNLANFQKFLTSASATNMASMLSAQTAAMYLNVASGGVNGNALVYAPGTNSANSLGYAKVSDLLTEANAILCTGGATKLVLLSGNPLRPRAEAVKTALDKANNNLTFVQSTPCPFSFAE